MLVLQRYEPRKRRLLNLGKLALLLLLVYLFLVSISLMGSGLKSIGLDYTKNVIAGTSNAFIGLFIGILVTSIIQSSSTTTSIVVGLVGGGLMTLNQAIPIVMGANIGTSITCTLVSMGHLRVKPELERAFSAAVVHDMFNLLTVFLMFPLQLKFNVLGKSAEFLENIFEQTGGLKFVSPLKLIVNPVVEQLEVLLQDTGWLIVIVAFIILFITLRYIVTVMKSLVLQRVTVFFNKVIFRSPLIGILSGLICTAIVQSSSVTTSLIVPLAGAGLVTLEQVFPFTLGANVGTTVTALMASMVTQNPTAVAVAFAHLLFNIFGIVIFLPLKFIPISMAKQMGKLAIKNRAYPIIFIVVTFVLVPIALINLVG